MKTIFKTAPLLLLIPIGSNPAYAEEPYPSRPIRLVLGFAAGGGTDVIARGIAQKMGDAMGGQVFVDNVTGANGNIGSDQVAKSRADGYTLLYNTSALILSPSLYTKLPYSYKDFQPVALTASLPIILVASPKSPYKSASDLIAAIKANPGRLNYASAGNGNITHLSALLLLQAIGGAATHVPYKGEAPAVTDVASGQVDFYAGTSAGVIPFIKDKRLIALAVGTEKRMSGLPDVPTLSEVVGKPLELGAWSGIVAPAGTKPEIVAKLNAAIQTALNDKDLLVRLAEQGAEPKHGTPVQYGRFITDEHERWDRIIKSNNARID